MNFQSGEIDDMRELFELLDIKSDVWKSTKDLRSSDYNRHHTKPPDRSRTTSKTDINSNESSKSQHDTPLCGSSHSESDRTSPSAGCSKETEHKSHKSKTDDVKVKNEVMSTESSNDEKEEGELDDECGDENKECGRVGMRRRSSLNPVNLSLARSSEQVNSETENSRDGDTDTSTVKVIKFTIDFQNWNYFIVLI